MKLRIPSIGNSFTSNKFTEKVQYVKELYEHVIKDEYLTNEGKYNFMSGNPIRFKSYGPSIKALKKELKSELYQYQPANGNLYDKKILTEYLKSIGIKSNVSNITFTYSTTHAYNLIFSCLAKPGDAIIIPTPNYGLFDFPPERYGLKVITIPLKSENDWLIDSNELENLIHDYNAKNKESRISFFYNINPHNPTGKVMGPKEKKLIKKIGEIALKNDIYIIDDLIYRDICFDENNLALPISYYKKYFNNVISLFGISKSHNLAALRSGFMVANEDLTIRFQDRIFQTMDSVSKLNIASITAAFNLENDKYYQKYFKKIRKEYIKKINLLKVLIEGPDSISNRKFRNCSCYKIKKVLKKEYSESKLLPSQHLTFLPNLNNIESGFFALLKVELKNVKTDLELFHKLFYEANVKVLCGKSLMWEENTKIIRINFAVEDEVLIKGIISLKEYLNKQ